MGQTPHRQPQTTAATPARSSKCIAVLVRHCDQMPEALRVGMQFCLAGMKVSVFAIGERLPASATGAWADMAGRLATHSDCYCCHPTDARRFGFETATLGQMTEKIADADLVISF